MLQKQGYSPLTATNGIEALHLAQAHDGPIRLLLTDVMMPEMSGPALARRLTAEAGHDTKVLMMSGYDQDVLAIERSWAFIQKPFSAQALPAIVQQLLSQPRSDGYPAASGPNRGRRFFGAAGACYSRRARKAAVL